MVRSLVENLTKDEQAAIQAVARQFSARWENAAEAHRAFLIAAGKRVGVDLRRLDPRGGGARHAAKPHLRFDKVVVRLMGRLHATADKCVPDGMSVLLAVSAPIRRASKTGEALEVKIRSLAGSRSTGRDFQATIHGNRIRIRRLKDASGRAPRLLGFVHNPGTDPVLLFNLTGELLELSSAPTRTRARRAGRGTGRWLVLLSPRPSSCLEAYRYIYSQLSGATGFKKILIVFVDGRLGLLASSD